MYPISPDSNTVSQEVTQESPRKRARLASQAADAAAAAVRQIPAETKNRAARALNPLRNRLAPLTIAPLSPEGAFPPAPLSPSEPFAFPGLLESFGAPQLRVADQPSALLMRLDELLRPHSNALQEGQESRACAPLPCPDLSAFGQQPKPKACISGDPAQFDFTPYGRLTAFGPPPALSQKEIQTALRLERLDMNTAAMKRRGATVLNQDPVDHPATPFIQAAHTIHETGRFSKNNHHFRLVPTEGKGAHNQIYRLEGDHRLVPAYANEEIAIRVFQKQIFTSRSAIQLLLETIRKNYIESRLAGIPINPILNLDTMMTDGYIAAPFIPHGHDLQPNNLMSLRDALAKSYSFSVPADMHHGTSPRYVDSNWRNSRLSSEPGGATLIDYLETTDSFLNQLGPTLKSFKRGNDQNEIVTDFLDPRVLDPEWDATTDLSTLNRAPELLRFIESKKKELTSEVIAGTKTIEEASEEFQNLVEIKKTEFGLGAISLRGITNLIHLKSNDGIVAKYRRGNQIIPIDPRNLDPIINGNRFVTDFLRKA